MVGASDCLTLRFVGIQDPWRLPRQRHQIGVPAAAPLPVSSAVTALHAVEGVCGSVPDWSIADHPWPAMPPRAVARMEPEQVAALPVVLQLVLLVRIYRARMGGNRLYLFWRPLTVDDRGRKVTGAHPLHSPSGRSSSSTTLRGVLEAGMTAVETRQRAQRAAGIAVQPWWKILILDGDVTSGTTGAASKRHLELIVELLPANSSATLATLPTLLS